MRHVRAGNAKVALLDNEVAFDSAAGLSAQMTGMGVADQ
jgi:hypothetical protein